MMYQRGEGELQVEVRCERCGCGFFFFQAEDGIRDLVRSRGLGDVYKRQAHGGFDDDVLQRSPAGLVQRFWAEFVIGAEPVLQLSLIHI